MDKLNLLNKTELAEHYGCSRERIRLLTYAYEDFPNFHLGGKNGKLKKYCTHEIDKWLNGANIKKLPVDANMRKDGKTKVDMPVRNLKIKKDYEVGFIGVGGVAVGYSLQLSVELYKVMYGIKNGNKNFCGMYL